MSNKFLNWLVTESGRNFSFYTATIITSSTLCAHFLPHTVFLDKYKDILHLYKHGISVPLPKSLLERFEKALDLVEVSEVDKRFYKPFFAYGFDVISAGCTSSRFGAIIGLPINFTYDNVLAVDRSRIKVNQDQSSVVWDSEEGQNLLHSLVLSEKAQLYAMAKEIKFRQKPKLYVDTFIAPMSCIFAYGLGHLINLKFNLLNRPRSLRMVLYSLIGLFSIGNYFMFKDLSQIYYEEKVDQELKEKNPIFVEGAQEYYTKILQRNVALRKILGKDGESLYTVLGNENNLFRNKHIPLVQRKKFFETPELIS